MNGLRDYGTALWDGGDAACDHAAKQPKRGKAEYTNGQGGSFSSNLQAWGDRDVSTVFRDTCGKCGAVRIDRQIGLEPTPEAYLQTMVEVFREVRRVLRSDGTCWVNMGDSYSSGSSGDRRISNPDDRWSSTGAETRALARSGVGKPKDLLMMPARLALALQADGWWVRSDIIIAKKNPMPESCRDRPTSAHEHVFLLTKNARYYFDPDAVREQGEGYGRGTGPGAYRSAKYVNGRSHDNSADAPQSGAHGHSFEGGRNIRNVWDISTEAFSGAHFATMPTSVVERAIKSGTSERGCCAQCGKPWVRVTETDYKRHENWFGNKQDARHSRGSAGTGYNEPIATRTTGWQPGCAHDADIVPCVVLDPFAGAGTTLLVADRLQRDAIGVELNTAYTEMAMDRVRADAPLFHDLAPVSSEDAYDRDMRDLFEEAAD